MLFSLGYVYNNIRPLIKFYVSLGRYIGYINLGMYYFKPFIFMICVHFIHHQFHVSCTYNHLKQKLYGVNFVVARGNNLVVNDNSLDTIAK